jgi:hypothetical protein
MQCPMCHTLDQREFVTSLQTSATVIFIDGTREVHVGNYFVESMQMAFKNIGEVTCSRVRVSSVSDLSMVLGGTDPEDDLPIQFEVFPGRPGKFTCLPQLPLFIYFTDCIITLVLCSHIGVLVPLSRFPKRTGPRW